MTNQRHGTIYVGVTGNLQQRAWIHRELLSESFVRRYRLRRLVWFEWHPDMPTAIKREKQLKAWPRHRKLELVDKLNPSWRDLFYDLF